MEKLVISKIKIDDEIRHIKDSNARKAIDDLEEDLNNIINDTESSTQSTYSSDKINELIEENIFNFLHYPV